MSLARALRAAMERGLDLVEVVPNADPPVCMLTKVGKYGRVPYEAGPKQGEQDRERGDDDEPAPDE